MSEYYESRMKSAIRIVAAGCFATLLLKSAARAEFINLEYGDADSTPSSAYGAAANQPGFWNILSGGNVTPDLLRDLSGALTNVTIEMSTVNLCYTRDNTGTFGDDQALLDDGLDLGGLAAPDRFTIRGLDPGLYDLYVYAWGPESPLFSTAVRIAGGPEVAVGGAWSGAHQFGITYRLQQVTITPGADLEIETRTLAGFGTLNGIQIVPEASPAALLLALALARRRRR